MKRSLLAVSIILFLSVCIEVLANDTQTGNMFTLETAVATVLAKSRQIQLADEELAAAERGYIGAVRALYPRVQLQATVNGDLFAAENFFDDENIATDLILDWNFYQNGQLRFRIHQGRTNLKIGEIKRRQRTRDIALETTSLYYDILKKRGALTISEKNHQLLQKQLEVVKQRVELGQEEESKLRDAEASFLEDQLQLTRKRQAYEMQLMRMRELLEIDSLPELAEVSLSIDTDVEITPEQCVLAAYDHRSAVLISSEMLQLSEKGARFSKLKRLPQVRFFSGSDFALREDDATEDLAFRAGLAVSYPLYDAGEIKRVIQSAESAFKQARIQYTIAKAEAELEVKQAYWEYLNQISLYTIGSERSALAEKNFRKAQFNFEVGQIGQSELTKAEIDYLQSRQGLHDLALDVLLAEKKLLNAVGVDDFSALEEQPLSPEVTQTGTEKAAN